MNVLAQMSWTQWFLAALLISICLLMMLVILLQKGRGQGLSGAFGGGGGGGAFGAKTGDIFTWVTIVFAAFFLLIAVVNNFAFDETPIPPSAVTLTGDDTGATDTPTGGSPENAIPIDIGDIQFDFGEGDKGEVDQEDPSNTDEQTTTQDEPVEQDGDPGNDNEGQ